MDPLTLDFLLISGDKRLLLLLLLQFLTCVSQNKMMKSEAEGYVCLSCYTWYGKLQHIQFNTSYLDNTAMTALFLEF